MWYLQKQGLQNVAVDIHCAKTLHRVRRNNRNLRQLLSIQRENQRSHLLPLFYRRLQAFRQHQLLFHLRRLRLLRDASGQESYIYTEKGSGLRMRREEERSLSLAEYQALRKQVVGRSICKVRYRVPLAGGYTAELDIYRDFLEGLVTVEVEFPSVEEAEAFQPPQWFGEDVTERPDFKNSALAQRAEPGFPD